MNWLKKTGYIPLILIIFSINIEAHDRLKVPPPDGESITWGYYCGDNI
jgi:hypothetical protein